MIKRFKILLLIAALGIVASACSSSSYAATVNGTKISDAEVLAVRSDDPSGGSATVGGETFRSDLTTLIVTRATALAAAEDYGLEDLESDDVRQAFLDSAEEGEMSIVNSVQSNPSLGSYAVDIVATQLAIRKAVVSAIAHDPDFIQSVWNDKRDLLLEVCARHILVNTEEEAQAAKDRIEAGEDFEAVAAEVSLDKTSPGGALPCPASPARFVEPFSSVVATGPVGELTDPFKTDFGWHIVYIDSRGAPQTFEEFAADPERWIPPTLLATEYNNWRDAAVRDTDITVRSQIGSWYPQGDGILAPAKSP